MTHGKLRNRVVAVAAVLVPFLCVLGLLAWGVGGQLSSPQVVRFAGFIPIVVVSAVLYDFCYRNAHVHTARYAVLGFASALLTATWGASLLRPWFTASDVLFGLACGMSLAASLVVVGKRRQGRMHP
jgi:hypothetical protein